MASNTADLVTMLSLGKVTDRGIYGKNERRSYISHSEPERRGFEEELNSHNPFGVKLQSYKELP